MNVLDRYLFRSVFGTCFGAIALFGFVLITGNILKEIAPYLFSGQIEYGKAAYCIALLIPFVVTFALPMGMLTGILLTLGRLSADSEITAMRSCGLSLGRVARPIIALAVLCSAGALYINHFTMPWARATERREIQEAIQANPVRMLVPRTFVRIPGNRFVVYAGNIKNGSISDLWAWQLDNEQRVVREIHAQQAEVTYDEKSDELIITLHNAIAAMRDQAAPESAKKAEDIGFFERNETVRIPAGARHVGRTKLDFLSWGELENEFDAKSKAPKTESPEQLKERELQLTRIRMVISERYNNALAVLSLALIGIPLGIKVSRRETSANLGVAVGIALGYFFLFTAVGWLDKKPALHPWLLLYVPNLLVCGVAWFLYRRLERR